MSGGLDSMVYLASFIFLSSCHIGQEDNPRVNSREMSVFAMFFMCVITLTDSGPYINSYRE